VFVVGSRSVLLSVAGGKNVCNFTESQKTRFVSSTKYNSLVVTMCTNGFDIKNFAVCSHSAFVCFRRSQKEKWLFLCTVFIDLSV
jgi:hypothetical protein